MKRPKRLAIFGVLCLVIGAFSLLHNMDQLRVAIVGPDAIKVPTTSEAPGQIGQMMRDTALSMRGAMGEPVYRVGVGIKSAASLLMSALLVAIGVGLMRDRLWAIRLAKAWALYGIVVSTVVVVLQAVYVVPHIPNASSAAVAGAQYVGIGFMLIVLCVFPVLLLTVLPSRNVLAYLNQRDSGTSVSTSRDTAPVLGDRPGITHTTHPTSAPHIKPTQATWRDDPWNDPNSQ